MFSFIYPFYSVSFEEDRLIGSFSTYYWSYMVDRYYFLPTSLNNLTFSFSVYWFTYWFSSTPALVGLGIPWTLISLFTVQVLTLVFGVAFIIFNRRILSFEPVLFGIAVLALMGCTVKVAHGYNALLDVFVNSSQYQLGYYLVYPSLVLFAWAFALNEVAKRRQTIS
jgi:hypothetical protein